MAYEIQADCQIPNLGQIYLDYLGDKNNGYFVEIGAYDGVTHSNTLTLLKKGWKGHYVEPSEQIFTLDNNLVEYSDQWAGSRFAVGCFNGVVPFRENGECSTVNPDFATIIDGLPFLPRAEEIRNYEVQQITMQSLLGSDHPIIDVLVVDTEGQEYDVLASNDWSKEINRPKMIIVELHECSPEWTQHDIVKASIALTHSLLTRYGYRKIFADEINTIYVC